PPPNSPSLAGSDTCAPLARSHTIFDSDELLALEFDTPGGHCRGIFDLARGTYQGPGTGPPLCLANQSLSTIEIRLRHAETEIGKYRAQTGAVQSAKQRRNFKNCGPETSAYLPNLRECRTWKRRNQGRLL